MVSDHKVTSCPCRIPASHLNCLHQASELSFQEQREGSPPVFYFRGRLFREPLERPHASLLTQLTLAFSPSACCSFPSDNCVICWWQQETQRKSTWKARERKSGTERSYDVEFWVPSVLLLDCDYGWALLDKADLCFSTGNIRIVADLCLTERDD